MNYHAAKGFKGCNTLPHQRKLFKGGTVEAVLKRMDIDAVFQKTHKLSKAKLNMSNPHQTPPTHSELGADRAAFSSLQDSSPHPGHHGHGRDVDIGTAPKQPCDMAS